MITVVSGFGRCGSSCVCQMLAAGGMDPTPKQRYPMFEDSRQTTTAPGPWVLEYEGKFLKWLDPVQFPPYREATYRVIWLDRFINLDLKEQVKSKVKFGKRYNPRRAVPQEEPTMRYKGQFMAELKERRPIALKIWKGLAEKILMLQYERILLDPLSAAMQINELVGGSLCVTEMADQVVPRSPKCREGFLEDELYRKSRGNRDV